MANTPLFRKGDILVPSDVPSKNEAILLTTDCELDSNPFSRQHWYHAKILFRDGNPLLRGLKNIIERRYVLVCNIREGQTAQSALTKIETKVAELRAANMAKYGKIYAYA